jgi:hypothetical protein
MATLKKLKEDRLNITSKILKKDEDFLPISPEFIKDLKDKTLLENSALKLSISDYQLMCRKDKVLNMMAIALNKPKAKLKKFCKHISIFEENISKSPKSIANKINGPITNLPIGVRSIILDKFAEILPTKYVLLDWIDKDKLDWDNLSKNPNAIDLLEDRIEYENSLTDAQFHQLQKKINWNDLSKNSNAINLLTENQDKINWKLLCLNPNAIELLKKNQDRIKWYLLCKNQNAIDLLKKRIEYEKTLIDKELDESEIKIDWEELSTNPNAIELLKKNQDKIVWEFLSTNPNAIDLLKERIEYEKALTDEELDESESKIDWEELSTNPNAIKLLKKNQDKIVWEFLSTNPNAINLLKKNQDKINWDYLSLNPNAIELLKKNQDKIKWEYLSANPNAIDLLKNRIKYEKSLTGAQFNQLENKINWRSLSENPNAINLLKENQDKINCFVLSANPSIFKAV